jgi:hypothetical protein
MKDGMEVLVQGLSGALKAPTNNEAAERLDRVEKAQLEIKQAQKAADEVAKERHEQLIALFQGQITWNTTSESRHEQFPFPSLDLSSCCFNLSSR